MTNMTIDDKVYGEFTITSAIANELIQTQSFQRIKGVCQFGVPNKYYHLDGFSRYEHSIGAYILLNTLGASEEEQIAGLLHDVSHTAFSHLVDWVIGDSEKEDYQDKRHLAVLKEKEIADILYAHGYSPEGVADYHRFKLLEQDMPGLCADRIDYVFRESPLEIAHACLPYLTIHDGEIVFTTENSAVVFAENFLKRQNEHWGGYEAITRYNLLSNLLKKALENGDIIVEDFFATDDFVIDKVIKANSPEYNKILNTLENKNLESLSKSEAITKKKFRYVDPKVRINETAEKLSHINSEFSQKIEEARHINESGTYAGIIR